MAGTIKLNLYGGKNCMLCDEAKQIAEAVLPRYGITYDYINIRSDDELSERYGGIIPVFSHEDTVLAYGHVSKDELISALILNGLIPASLDGPAKEPSE